MEEKEMTVSELFEYLKKLEEHDCGDFKIKFNFQK